MVIHLTSWLCNTEIDRHHCVKKHLMLPVGPFLPEKTTLSSFRVVWDTMFMLSMFLPPFPLLCSRFSRKLSDFKVGVYLFSLRATTNRFRPILGRKGIIWFPYKTANLVYRRHKTPPRVMMNSFETINCCSSWPEYAGVLYGFSLRPASLRGKESIGIGNRFQFLIITEWTLQFLVKPVNHLFQEEVSGDQLKRSCQYPHFPQSFDKGNISIPCSTIIDRNLHRLPKSVARRLQEGSLDLTW